MGSLFDKVFTLLEFKGVILGLSFLTIVGFAIYNYQTNGDFTNNMTDVIKTFVYVLGAVHGLDGVSAVMDKANKMKAQTKVKEQPENKRDLSV